MARATGVAMQMFLSDASSVIDAAELIARFGVDAEFEAAMRAGVARDRGNHLRFCRWRQIERLIALLACDEPVGNVH